VAKEIEVLVLDDEAIVCERLKDFFEAKDLIVEAFTESEKAIERMKKKNFDVVVTDMKMPGRTGMDVLQFIKDNHPSTQVIIISAYSLIDKFRDAEAMGVYEYVTKPFQLSNIYNLVVKAAKRAKKQKIS